ncbi:methyl-accepting chemotaxis protein [Motilimonas pumila]|uniref:Methyl-accepting chemotaxis protein n=1 Tax=Motilimonas pumila TaxID=2303987 RepID=A0A418YKN7_9GAMM|nr:methyl-accepting chemotaxis protein [Motilimonas pumila]RJG51533.1 methyl-accepting chemotaxis protein [Motilimonas pumila]
MKLTVKQKISLAFISVISLMLLIAGVIYTQLVSAEKVASEIRNDDVPGVTLYLTLIDESGDVFRDALKIVAGYDNAEQDFYANLGEYRDALDKLIPLESATQSDRENMKAIARYIDLFQQDVEQKIIAKINSEDKTQLFVTLGELSDQHLSALEKLLDAQSASEKAEADQALDSLLESFSTMENVAIILTCVGLIFSSVVAYILSNSITSRLLVLDAVAQKVAEGDLTAPAIVDNSGDELSNLAASINAMQSSLKELIGSISQVGEQVQAVSRDLSQVSQEIVDGASEQANKANLIATASEELSLTIAEVAQQSVSTADIASDSGDSAQSGRNIILEMVKSIQQVSLQMEEMSGQMGKLGDRSDQIGSVIKVIEDIAEQTNLLALNAAIEAARAGELGRGFAVVADEVRALAERTTQATNEVGGIIQAIQSGTQEAVSVTTESKQLVEVGVSQSSGAGEALEQIVTSVQNVKDMIHTIATATEEQTAVTKEIATDITVIHDISEQSLKLASKGSDSTMILGQKVNELEQLLSRFKLS